MNITSTQKTQLGTATHILHGKSQRNLPKNEKNGTTDKKNKRRE